MFKKRKHEDAKKLHDLKIHAEKEKEHLKHEEERKLHEEKKRHEERMDAISNAVAEVKEAVEAYKNPKAVTFLNPGLSSALS